MQTSEVRDDVRLPIVSESAASGETAALYAEIREHFRLGFVPDVFQLPGSRPSFLGTLWAGYRSMFAEGVLPRATKEHIATLVARDAGCRYCVDAHVLFLDLVGAGPEVVDAARVASIDDMPIDDKLRELLRFVQRIDHQAYKIVDADLDHLREIGWADDELLEAVWTACLFNAIVRLADTFGLYRIGQLATPTESVCGDRVSATRRVAAAAHAIFLLVSDPARHVDIDGSRMLQAAPDARPLTAVGQTFDMDMDRRPLGDIPNMAEYKVRCTVTQLIPDRLIEWTVRAVGKPPAGHVYGWQIEPLTDDQCLVSNYCDWTNISNELRAKFRWPVVPVDRLQHSVENLGRIATRVDE